MKTQIKKSCSSVDRLPFQSKDRDVFRIGGGVEVFKLFKKEDAPKIR